MSRLFARVALLVALVPTWCAAQEAPPDFSKAGLAFLKQHCLECHSGDKPKAELSLAGFIDNGSVVKKRKTWESGLKMVESGEMPPDDKPQPTAKEIEDFASLARAVFDHHDKHAKPDPGRVTARRLNRVEYTNTIRDLLAVDFRAEKVAHKDQRLRTFITHDAARRDLVNHIYDITRGTVFPDDTLVVVDDSIVRGTTLRESIITMLARLNPKGIVVASSSPPIMYPDCYGIDMSQLGRFIAFEAAVALAHETGQSQVLDEIDLDAPVVECAHLQRSHGTTPRHHVVRTCDDPQEIGAR